MSDVCNYAIYFFVMLAWREFVDQWTGSKLTERSGYQQHFSGICSLFGLKPPAHYDQSGETFTFERRVSKALGGKGYADVWKRDFFAWEYKSPNKSLKDAYSQLLNYHGDLEYPPLLVVSDFERFEVHTCWNKTKPRKFEFRLCDLLKNETTPACAIPPQEVLRAVLLEPEQLRPEQVSAKVTEAAALRFSQLAERLELEGPNRLTGEGKIEVAHFLMKLLFCLFADSVGLLPEHLFRRLIEQNRSEPKRFVKKLRGLFQAMAKPDGTFGPYDISWFNGGLFDDRGVVLDLTRADMGILYEVSRLDWSAVEPAIFGTLFERSLDAAKRKLIGAHYTSSADIRLLLEPVMVTFLRKRWDEIHESLRALDEQLKDAPPTVYRRLRRQIEERLVDWITELSSVRVLDPACGSGNFLYVALKELLDLWLVAAQYAADRDLKTILPETVGPHQLYGIECDFYAHQLASIVVWIGYLQWRHQTSLGFNDQPILKKLETIQHADAILCERDGAPCEPVWPHADYIVGNPPFLGGKLLRRKLGDRVVNDLFKVYKGRVPAEADLVAYWFEKARAQVEQGKAKRVGLLGTQAIRKGANRLVLDRVKESASIFWAESDRPWSLDGAAVRISMVGFDNGEAAECMLNGRLVGEIHADLSSGVYLSSAKPLRENQALCFMGSTKVGKFELSYEDGRRMLALPLNPNKRPNSDVVKLWVNAKDITGRTRNRYIVDFGVSTSEADAALYEAPFEYVKKWVKPERVKNNRQSYARKWWLHAEPRRELRASVKQLKRYVSTPRVAKHRVFVWHSANTIPDSRLLIFARDDDYFFGMLSSRFHESWSLANASWHGIGNDPTYVKETCFETFPFPWEPGTEPNSDSRLISIAFAAQKLNSRREAWLNPEGASASDLKGRTLTNLYNERPQWLSDLHSKLDECAAAAYGWKASIADKDVISHLLDLNQERARVQGRNLKKPSVSITSSQIEVGRLRRVKLVNGE